MAIDSTPLSSLGLSALAAAIEARAIGRGKNRWTAQVIGVHSSPEEVWVQVARQTRRSASSAGSVVLRLSRRATTAHAIAALEHAPGIPASYPHVIDVMRAV